MVNCLKRLGSLIEVVMIRPSRPTAPSRFTDTAGGLTNAGTLAQSLTLELFVENAGTAARFLSPFLCLGHAYCRLCCPTRPAKTRAMTATEMSNT